jgi:Flp pilus assembly protein TadD
VFSNRDQIAAEGSRPDLAQKHHERGVRLVKHGKLDRAEMAFQEAIIADKTFGPAHNNLGRIQFDRHDLHSAAWSFQRAIERMPDRAEPLNNLGLTYEAAGKPNEASEMYMAALNLAPDNAEYLGNLIRSQMKSGDEESLEYDLERLLSLDTRPDWLNWAELKLVMLRRQRPPANTDEELLPTPAAPRATGEPELPLPPRYEGELPPPVDQGGPVLPGPQRMIDVR